MTRAEKRLALPTPQYQVGTAEYFIQWIDANTVLWIDHGSAEPMKRMLDDNSYLLPDREALQRVVREGLRQQNAWSAARLEGQIDALVRESNARPDRRTFVLLRCPNEIPYRTVMESLARLSEGRFVEYGCIGGSFDQLRFDVPERTDRDGNLHRSIRIDFQP
jgi:hypothetical protein